jgi:hypothetical protein
MVEWAQREGTECLTFTEFSWSTMIVTNNREEIEIKILSNRFHLQGIYPMVTIMKNGRTMDGFTWSKERVRIKDYTMAE